MWGSLVGQLCLCPGDIRDHWHHTEAEAGVAWISPQDFYQKHLWGHLELGFPAYRMAGNVLVW